MADAPFGLGCRDDVHEQVRVPANTALQLLLPASVGLAVATLLMALPVVAVARALPMDTPARSGAVVGVVAVLTLVGGVLYAVVLPRARLILGDRSLHPL